MENFYIQNFSMCIVFICTSNYLPRFIYTYNQLISIGKYIGDVCLVVGDDLKDINFEETNIIIKHFPEFTFSDEFKYFIKNLDRDSRWNQRFFQYNKFQLFDEYFKKWQYIFYLDCGITIYDDINIMINSYIIQANGLKFLAHSDAYPTYENKLSSQFVKTGNAKECYKQLEKDFDLNIDYPQTTIMFYNTKIIEPNTVKDLYNLLLKYPISVTNDQGIIALYFTSIKKYFEQIITKGNTIDGIETFFYDYHRRDKSKKYVMVKCLF